MQLVKNALKRLWAIYWIIIFAVVFLCFYPIFLITLSRTKWYPAAHQVRRVWSKLLFLLTGLIYKVEYAEKFLEFYDDPTRSPVIFCSNHTSYLDIPIIAIVIPNYLRFMAKAELSKIPLFNIFFRTIDISVDRTNKRAALKAYKEGLASLDQNASLVIFPEGTTSHHPPHLLEFKNGAFKMAIEKKVPIVPITLLDNWKRFPNDGKLRGTPGNTKMIIHAPIDTSNLQKEDVSQLKEEVYQTIHKTLEKAELVSQTSPDQLQA